MAGQHTNFIHTYLLAEGRPRLQICKAIPPPVRRFPKSAKLLESTNVGGGERKREMQRNNNERSFTVE